MLVPGILGLQGLVLGSLLAVVLLVRHKWNNAVARKDEMDRLLASATEETAAAEAEAVGLYYSSMPRQYQCAVCYNPTTTRCSRCKAVHYCSGKCQIIHWRQGHKYECCPPTSTTFFEEGSEFGEERPLKNYSETHINDFVIEDAQEMHTSGARSECPFDVSPIGNATSLGRSDVDTSLVNNRKGNAQRRKRKDVRSLSFSESSDHPTLTTCDHSSTGLKSELPDKIISISKSPQNTCNGDAQLFKGKHVRSLSSFASGDHSSSDSKGCSDISCKSGLPPVISGAPDLPEEKPNGLKSSVRKVLKQFGASKESKHQKLGFGNEVARRSTYKILFPYELFIELYCDDEVELYPFGLTNCGNSCYANAVLQCLAFTRPLTSYLVRGFHSEACPKKEWCFICEFEILIMKARGGESTLSPIRILSKIQKVSRFSQGSEEDAHEFLRYAVETMQSACLKEVGNRGKVAEETTFVGLTFGGFLRSKIKCMKCLCKSERIERMMDLTVEIDGDIGTLEEALSQFTASEVLDGENKYRCNRCKSYEKAWKKLTVLEAPNVLTIVMKRFQLGNYGKLNKFVQFPEVLDMSPYTSGTSDKSPLFSLYAVVVHLDTMNAAFSGHYVCYVKNFRGEWFRIDDSMVIPVELERVLTEGAYMLLYARHSPRASALERNLAISQSVKSKKQNLEAVPSSHNQSKRKSSSNATSTVPLAQRKPVKCHYQRSLEGSSANQFFDPDFWRFHSKQRFSTADSSSESSSLFSYSDASSCSTTSTKDSSHSEDLSDYIFGDVKPSWYRHYGLPSDL
ncbi:Ubiquitin-specific protease 17 putative isoform 1 [Tripterygium wilfordii]|uniref:ubiquitinyl hydrolase 1 n=1 Tax=Tripterygium wilfordii TaxID=458696 RepID=A0A7J7DLY0_TRIWF|nr:ubiquitin carboxyl-terminal hydrolase 16 [Tripterygium wilfordii]KAF5747328.1 Ubiquitin-specific protease 17 putative isoform 1 [Tripterygium wilfordii]